MLRPRAPGALRCINAAGWAAALVSAVLQVRLMRTYVVREEQGWGLGSANASSRPM